MRKTKASELASFGASKTSPPLDIQALATAIAQAMGTELREILKEIPAGAILRHKQVGAISETIIQIDDSIIPMKVESNIQEVNLENLGKKEKKVDKGLDKSKSKLAGLLKNKRSK